MLTQIILVSALNLTLFSQKADDTKDLEVFLDEVVEDIESRDGKSFQAKWHKKSTLYSRRFFFPFDRAEVGSDDWSELWVDFFSRIDKIDFKETDFSCRRIGDIGRIGQDRSRSKRLRGFTGKTPIDAEFDQRRRFLETAELARFAGPQMISFWRRLQRFLPESQPGFRIREAIRENG